MKLDGSKILVLRLERCWSQDQLAQAVGLSVRSIQRIEKGGSGSLESMKSLSAVFETTPATLNQKQEPYYCLRLMSRFSWAFAFFISVVLLGTWVVDILIPTLKGADFNQQYEIHNNFRYLDLASLSFFIGVAILLFRVIVSSLKSRSVKLLIINN